MRRAWLRLSTISAVAVPCAVVAWLLGDWSPRRSPSTSEHRVPSVAVVGSAGAAELAPSVLEPPPRDELGPLLARAIELANDLDPRAEEALLRAIERARALRSLEVLETAQRELARYRDGLRIVAREAATRLAAEARALAREGSPAALGRFVEAIDAAREVGDVVRPLEEELGALRSELWRRDLARAIERSRSPEPDGSEHDDEHIRLALKAFEAGDTSLHESLIGRLEHRIWVENSAGNAARAFRDLALVRRVVRQFYAQSLVAFDALVRKRGTAESALAVAHQAIEQTDPFKTLGFEDLGDFVRTVDGLLAAAK